MALVPCKVCGSLNSDQEEICLSCGYPTQGYKRPAIFVWAALVLAVLFALPPLMGVANWLFYRLNPPEPTPEEPKPLAQPSSTGADLLSLDAVTSQKLRVNQGF